MGHVALHFFTDTRWKPDASTQSEEAVRTGNDHDGRR